MRTRWNRLDEGVRDATHWPGVEAVLEQSFPQRRRKQVNARYCRSHRRHMCWSSRSCKSGVTNKFKKEMRKIDVPLHQLFCLPQTSLRRPLGAQDLR